MLSDALEAIPENTPEKEARAAAMDAEEKAGHLPDTYAESAPLDRRVAAARLLMRS